MGESFSGGGLRYEWIFRREGMLGEEKKISFSLSFVSEILVYE